MQSLLYGLFSESPWNSESVQIPYKIINDSLWAKLTCFPYNNIYIICYHYTAQRELDEIPLGRHRMASAFMRGVRRLRPVRPTAVPSLDLSVVLEGLVTAPFEPLESTSERILTLKVTLLLALTSLKRVGDLHGLCPGSSQSDPAA